MNMMDEVRDFLEKNNLNQYADKFLYLGYDDMTQLQEMPSYELADVMKEIGIFERPGHRKRFISALQILNSKSKHGIPSTPNASSSTTMAIDSHVVVETSKFTMNSSL